MMLFYTKHVDQTVLKLESVSAGDQQIMVIY